MTKLQSPSAYRIANNLSLFREYVDPNGLLSEEEFEDFDNVAKYDMMRDCGMSFRLSGMQALRYADAHDLTVNKYADPTEDAREGLTIEEAVDIMHQDQSLIWLQVGTEDDSEDV